MARRLLLIVGILLIAQGFGRSTPGTQDQLNSATEKKSNTATEKKSNTATEKKSLKKDSKEYSKDAPDAKVPLEAKPGEKKKKDGSKKDGSKKDTKTPGGGDGKPAGDERGSQAPPKNKDKEDESEDQSKAPGTRGGAEQPGGKGPGQKVNGKRGGLPDGQLAKPRRKCKGQLAKHKCQSPEASCPGGHMIADASLCDAGLSCCFEGTNDECAKHGGRCELVENCKTKRVFDDRAICPGANNVKCCILQDKCQGEDPKEAECKDPDKCKGFALNATGFKCGEKYSCCFGHLKDGAYPSDGACRSLKGECKTKAQCLGFETFGDAKTCPGSKNIICCGSKKLDPKGGAERAQEKTQMAKEEKKEEEKAGEKKTNAVGDNAATAEQGAKRDDEKNEKEKAPEGAKKETAPAGAEKKF